MKLAAPTATEQTSASPTTTLKLYEGMFLLDGGRFATDAKGVTDQITGMLEKCGGTLVAHRPWQDGRLAYAIKGHRKGLHYLTYFKMHGGGIRDLNRACKLNDLVLRHVVIEHPQAMFDAMVQAISGEWHPHEAAQDEPQGRGRDRGDRGERGDRDRDRDRDRGDRDRGDREDRGRGEQEGEFEE
jgi:small subunit ribosomal protein S6